MHQDSAATPFDTLPPSVRTAKHCSTKETTPKGSLVHQVALNTALHMVTFICALHKAYKIHSPACSNPDMHQSAWVPWPTFTHAPVKHQALCPQQNTRKHTMTPSSGCQCGAHTALSSRQARLIVAATAAAAPARCRSPVNSSTGCCCCCWTQVPPLQLSLQCCCSCSPSSQALPLLPAAAVT